MLGQWRNPRKVWLTFFVIVNMLCGVIIYESNGLLGETAELRLNDRSLVAPAVISVVLTYLVILGWLFPTFSKIPMKTVLKPSPRQEKRVGTILFLLQVAFIIFCQITGAFVAGSTTRSDSIFSAMWVIISVDALFFIYYGFYRDSKLFLPNLIIAVVSNILRGWSGIFILIAFMESARLIRRGRLSAKLVLSTALVFVVAYPILNLAKLQIRFMSSGAEINASFLDLAKSTAAGLDASDYVNLIGASTTQLLARIHLVSNTIAVNQNVALLAGGVQSGEIAPFWQEGIYGIAYARITHTEVIPNLGVALAVAIDPSQEEGSWNSNPGYVSWLIIDPASAPLYIAYTAGLIFLCFLLVRRMGGTTQAMDMLWFACLSYMVPGWTASFVLFFNTLLIFYLFHWFTRDKRPVAAPPSREPAPWPEGSVGKTVLVQATPPNR